MSLSLTHCLFLIYLLWAEVWELLLLQTLSEFLVIFFFFTPTVVLICFSFFYSFSWHPFQVNYLLFWKIKILLWNYKNLCEDKFVFHPVNGLLLLLVYSHRVCAFSGFTGLHACFHKEMQRSLDVLFGIWRLFFLVFRLSNFFLSLQTIFHIFFFPSVLNQVPGRVFPCNYILGEPLQRLLTWGWLFSKAVLSLLQPGLPAVQAAPAVVSQRPQHYQEPAMPFPVVQPTTVASLQLGQPQPVLASQQVRAWPLPKSAFLIPFLARALLQPIPVASVRCLKLLNCSWRDLGMGQRVLGLRDGRVTGSRTIVAWYLGTSWCRRS